MAITIKKKKLTVTSPAAVPAKDEPAPAQPQATNETDEIIAETPTSKTSNGTSYTLSAIFALIAVVLFIALILIQMLEMSYYKAPPNAFPVISAVTSIPRPSREKSNIDNSASIPTTDIQEPDQANETKSNNPGVDNEDFE